MDAVVQSKFYDEEAEDPAFPLPDAASNFPLHFSS